MTIQQYIDKLNTRYKSGITTEHSFRGDLQTLLETIIPDTLTTNEPTRIKCGAPDYILTKKGIPVGYIEAKDLGADLNNKGYKEQFTRYKEALSNLIITNYLDFWVFKDGELVATYSIGALADGKIIGKLEQYEAFTALIKNFSDYIGQTIKSAQKLAEMMAHKAKILASVIDAALTSDEETTANSTLQEQYRAFQDILIHDITPKGFADIYAQTIAYGMFAARLHDPSLESFTRQEAAELIPRSNPFLRKLFQYIAGYDLDARIVWIVDALADIFRATDVKALLKNFGKATKQHDPIIHFYETFLSEYDPKLRKSRGVWYTPEPVVNFIVRAVDYILKTEFRLSAGLADTSKVKVKKTVVAKASANRRSHLKEVEVEEEVHRVQILDPATGTGTFLAEVIRQIHEKFAGQEGIWTQYVEKDLIPRINGFELLMASYAMAHLKLDMLLTETGYKSKTDQRLKVYLTNSLEEHHPDTGTLFASWLSNEANEANKIKRDVPVMVVLGNPPYALSSSNASIDVDGKKTWIGNLIDDYKKGLNEKKVNVEDDYVKFIRYGQFLIDKTGTGVLAYISNNSFLEGISHRGMRKSLLDSFSKIYIVDLHGNSKKKETTPDGDKDENVFDIMPGVSINIFIKTDKKPERHAEVYHFDCYGKREEKYDFLLSSSIDSTPFKKISCESPEYYFADKDLNSLSEYREWINLLELMPLYNNGIKTDRDKLFIDYDNQQLKSRIQKLLSGSIDPQFADEFNIHDSGSYKITSAIANQQYSDEFIHPYLYNPFDYRHIYYNSKIISRPAKKVSDNLVKTDNFGLILGRQANAIGNGQFDIVFATRTLVDTNLFRRGGNAVLPLYCYENDLIQNTRIPNLNLKLAQKIADSLGVTFENEKTNTSNNVSPVDLFDYIYSILHSPTYREKYKEFLKIDFPRIPYPTDKKVFWKLVKLGGELRQMHLLENPVVDKYITKYPRSGSNIVEKPEYKDGNVWINSEQYFEGVPETAWNFYIGGYQPAQKWLKDRKGRELSIEDIQHYQKIIVALSETDRIMKEIDKIEFV